MEIIGRLTKDAQIKTLKDERKLVAFSIAINDSYKSKDGSWREHTTFINCSYWLNTKVTEHLTKGSIVQLYGHIAMNIYSSMGEAKGCLNFHVNNLKIVMKYKAGQKGEAPVVEPRENLPF